MTTHAAQTKPKKRIEVVAAAIYNGTEILAAKRGEGMSLAGLWEFPGGKIEPGEAPRDALRRELEEELHCQAEIGEYVNTTDYEYDFGVVSLATFICTVEGSAPIATEHAEIRWVPVAELPTLEWAPADIPAVERLVELLAS
ncbi:(deoxy)nucleoside triphosphate pyrophosphohydrolase [Leucobacter sp. HY1910]